jgi:hypothetical protein
LQEKLRTAVTDIDDLYPIRRYLQKMYPDLSKPPASITSKPIPISQIRLGDPKYDVVIIGVCTRINPRYENEEVVIQRRGYALKENIPGGLWSLNLFVKDDTDEVFCKIEREHYEQMGKDIVDRGVRSQAIYALKGYVPATFRMLKVERVRYLGNMREKVAITPNQEGGQHGKLRAGEQS